MLISGGEQIQYRCSDLHQFSSFSNFQKLYGWSRSGKSFVCESVSALAHHRWRRLGLFLKQTYDNFFSLGCASSTCTAKPSFQDSEGCCCLWHSLLTCVNKADGCPTMAFGCSVGTITAVVFATCSLEARPQKEIPKSTNWKLCYLSQFLFGVEWYHLLEWMGAYRDP